MSKRKQWDNFKNKLAAKRMGKKERVEEGEYLTVQQLSASVEGKAQKYTRIGPLTMVPFKHEEKTMQNVRQACKDHFSFGDEYHCDILAGERGPSYTNIGQIKNWKLLHVRFIESDGQLFLKDSSCASSAQQINTRGRSGSHKEGSTSLTISVPDEKQKSSMIPKSVPLSQLIMMGKLIPPKKNVVTLQLEQFNVTLKCWENPLEAILSVSVEKFASGGCRDAFEANGMKGFSGKLVLKRYKPERIDELTHLFNSLDDHTRKVVQMHAIARHFAQMMQREAPLEFGETFTYTKLYYGKLNDEAVTVEQFIEGTFVKYINNTGDILVKDQSAIALKAESFAHYSYVKSGEQLIIVDLQGVGFTLFDPEIASTTLYADDNSIYFCAGNLSITAIETFLVQHKCNRFCKLLKLEEV
ncbi:Transient receptor potential cation channel subfamily M member 6 [Paramuricea clavata]|uniref:Transient receptor potential cation channel subfamily M member 6 n=1 Tax=Paramuricea clavata TaxID=317549 RepID=A0A6S7JRM6_PARCT|nr:Transient receptor potential cation channel subfamily M member 6 [Paramuricea clavata]